jgi:hypothetical protein
MRMVAKRDISKTMHAGASCDGVAFVDDDATGLIMRTDLVACR